MIAHFSRINHNRIDEFYFSFSTRFLSLTIQSIRIRSNNILHIIDISNDSFSILINNDWHTRLQSILTTLSIRRTIDQLPNSFHSLTIIIIEAIILNGIENSLCNDFLIQVSSYSNSKDNLTITTICNIFIFRNLDFIDILFLIVYIDHMTININIILISDNLNILYLNIINGFQFFHSHDNEIFNRGILFSQYNIGVHEVFILIWVHCDVIKHYYSHSSSNFLST